MSRTQTLTVRLPDDRKTGRLEVTRFFSSKAEAEAAVAPNPDEIGRGWINTRNTVARFTIVEATGYITGIESLYYYQRIDSFVIREDLRACT